MPHLEATEKGANMKSKIIRSKSSLEMADFGRFHFFVLVPQHLQQVTKFHVEITGVLMVSDKYFADRSGFERIEVIDVGTSNHSQSSSELTCGWPCGGLGICVGV